MLDPETKRKMKDHICLYHECDIKLDPEDYTKGLCPWHLVMVRIRKRLFPKEFFHPAYGGHDNGFRGYGVQV